MRKQWSRLAKNPIIAFGLRVYQRYGRAETYMLASALAYYAAFSLGPLLLLLTGFAAIVLRRQPQILASYQDALTDLVTVLLPVQEDANQLAEQSLQLILAQLDEGTFWRSLISVGILVWASSNFFTFLQLALRAYFFCAPCARLLAQKVTGYFIGRWRNPDYCHPNCWNPFNHSLA